MHVEALGQHTVILNSAKAVKELFERRSTIYSSRPKVVMMGELLVDKPPFFAMQHSTEE